MEYPIRIYTGKPKGFVDDQFTKHVEVAITLEKLYFREDKLRFIAMI